MVAFGIVFYYDHRQKIDQRISQAAAFALSNRLNYPSLCYANAKEEKL